MLIETAYMTCYLTAIVIFNLALTISKKFTVQMFHDLDIDL